MIFKEVAIEPAYLSNWDRLRAIVDQCGFDHGRLIADFPKNKWQWHVVESCRNCLPAEKKRVEEYLKNVKPKLTRRGRSFFELTDWLENAKREHACSPFHVVVTSGLVPGFPDFVEGAELHNGHPKWQIKKDAVILRTTKAMGEEAQELLGQAKEVLFIDRNFEPRGAYTKPLCRFVELAIEGAQVTRLEYHLGHDSTSEHFFGKLKAAVMPYLRRAPKANLKFIRWKSNPTASRDAMHPRYILTDLGGLRYDYGLCEGKEGETTDVQIIEKAGAIYQQRWAEFSAGSTSFKFEDGFEISPKGVFELCIRDGQFQAVNR